MKSKQINKFLLMFFLSFTLFFSVSNAEWSSSPSSLWNSEITTSLDNFGGYTLAQIATFYGSSDIEAYNNMVSVVSDAGYYFVYMPYGSTSSDLVTLVFSKDSSVDIGANLYGTNNQFLMGTFLEIGSTLYYRSGTSNYARKCTVAGCYFKTNGTSLTLDTFNANIAKNKYYYGNFPYIKNLLYANALYSYTWDGTYLYEIPGVEEPDTPSIDYDLSNIVSNIILSSEVQNNTDATSREFFITPNGTVADEEVYELYFYNSRVNLSQFEYLYNDVSYYDLDKTSVDGILAKIVDLVGGYKTPEGRINPLAEIKHFTMYYNPEAKSSDIYLTSTRSIDTLKSFRSDVSPIIYTTKDIAYYSATWGEIDTEWTAVPDENKNILSVPLTDSDGNEIVPVVPGSEAPLSDTPWNTFVSFIHALMNSIINKIGVLLKSILGLGLDLCNVLLQIFGENVVTFVLVIVVKSITVLVSSVALIFRFISFVMTLVAIPASSALLAADVASNSSGLVFTGLSWGTHFVDGLNFIKTIQWNGLGLWTLFEVFVASLEVVLFVKIVRKHYRTL